MKIKNLLITMALSIAIFSCGSDSSDDNFDAEAQAIKDDVTLIDYLKSHYLAEETSTIGEIKSGEQSLFSKVQTSEIKHNDINYKMYYIILKEGAGAKASKFDSVLVDFSGIKLDSTYFQYKTLDSRIDLTGYLYRRTGPAAMAFASNLLKQGTKIINEDESFYFENSGEGIFFVPSGLAFENGGTASVDPNTPLIFKIKLNAFKESDNDHDGRFNKDEDANKDGDLSNDDTDNDGLPNYLDKDN